MNYLKMKNDNRIRIEKYVSENTNGIVDFFPRYIQIEMTNRCNAKCIMCNHFYLGNNHASDISKSVMRRLEPIFPYCETVMLNGDGEPFLCKNIVDNIKLLSKYKVEIGTNTNLSYIPEELWLYLKNDFKFLNISCDGATEATYEMIRKGLSFSTFISNLERLNEEAPNLRKNIDCVVMKQNVLELPQIVELAAKYNINCVKFQRLGVNPCIGNQIDEPENFYTLLISMLEKSVEVGNELGVEVVYPQYKAKDEILYQFDASQFEHEINERYREAALKYGDMSLDSDYYSELITCDDFEQGKWCAGKICQWALERCYVDLKGNVTTCCFNIKKYMGNLMQTSFDEIWNGTSYILFRKMMGKKKLPYFCKNCNWIKESRF